MTTTSRPSWAHCGQGSSAVDPVGCRGITLPGLARCLAHADRDGRAAFLSSLAPGSDFDLRGTSLGAHMLGGLKAALTDPATGRCTVGIADFSAAVFTAGADFSSTVFTAGADFSAATFSGQARFSSAVFRGYAGFGAAVFAGPARFGAVDFAADASFDSATFGEGARFVATTFAGNAAFGSASFASLAEFAAATFAADAGFSSAAFARSARFSSVTFTGPARFDNAAFAADASFDSAAFAGAARFDSATFTGAAAFGSAVFSGAALFGSATFSGPARFDNSAFGADASFDSAAFAGPARFDSASFAGNARFSCAAFTDAGFAATAFARSASFRAAVFEGAQRIGPLACAENLDFQEARFTGQQVSLEAACTNLSFARAVFAGTASVRLRYAAVFLSGAAFGGKLALQARPLPFDTPSGLALDESAFGAGRAGAGVRLLRMDAVDAATLVLSDVDLSDCEFSGAFHLDRIRLGLGCAFRRPPDGWHPTRGLVPARWSRRKTLAEEHHWRALDTTAAGAGWRRGPRHPRALLTPGPGDLTEIYQQLRKAFEDSGDEPDAADFYYGEMEMRRHDRSRPRAERGLLWLYWLLSGYGLRASRALACLLAAMAASVLLLLAIGLPDGDPVPRTTGTSQSGQVRLATSTPGPALTAPFGERFTGVRADRAVLVVVNSVVFRSSGQNLTTPGTVVEMLSRVGEPVLLGLAALAVRGRVKR